MMIAYREHRRISLLAVLDVSRHANMCVAVPRVASWTLQWWRSVRDHLPARISNVTWHCNDGHLTLRGCVPNFYLKQVLQELLHGIGRVKLITNSVDVVSSTGMSSVRSDNRGHAQTIFTKVTWHDPT